MLIAYLEDDMDQARTVTGWFDEFGFEYEHFSQAQALLKRLKDRNFDAAVLDWELPHMPGTEALRQIREKFHQELPVLFCSMRDSEEDVVTALELGADDYMRKPLLKTELKARLSALLRRIQGPQQGDGRVIEHGAYRFDLKSREAYCDGIMVEMTDKDFELATCLFAKIGRIMSRGFLLDAVWGVSTDLNTRTVDVHISRIRKALGITPASGYRIKTIYQHGYRLERIDQG